MEENKNLDFFEVRKLNNGKTVLSNRDRSRNLPFETDEEIEKAKKFFARENNND